MLESKKSDLSSSAVRSRSQRLMENKVVDTSTGRSTSSSKSIDGAKTRTTTTTKTFLTRVEAASGSPVKSSHVSTHLKLFTVFKVVFHSVESLHGI